MGLNRVCNFQPTNSITFDKTFLFSGILPCYFLLEKKTTLFWNDISSVRDRLLVYGSLFRHTWKLWVFEHRAQIVYIIINTTSPPTVTESFQKQECIPVRMRTGRTLTVFRWRPPPQNLEEPPPKIWRPPENLEEPPTKIGDTPQKLETPPPPPKKNWRPPGSRTRHPPGTRTRHPPPREQNEWQTLVKILPWPNFVSAANKAEGLVEKRYLSKFISPMPWQPFLISKIPVKPR